MKSRSLTEYMAKLRAEDPETDSTEEQVVLMLGASSLMTMLMVEPTGYLFEPGKAEPLMERLAEWVVDACESMSEDGRELFSAELQDHVLEDGEDPSLPFRILHEIATDVRTRNS